MHEYKIVVMEDVPLANRRGRREGDKSEGKREIRVTNKLQLTYGEGGVCQTGR